MVQGEWEWVKYVERTYDAMFSLITNENAFQITATLKTCEMEKKSQADTYDKGLLEGV